MFTFGRLIVSPQQDEHIWSKHQVHPEEVEEVCFGRVVGTARTGPQLRCLRSELRRAGILRSSCTREGRVSIAWQRHGR